MSAYGSATINAAAAAESGGQPVQPPIGSNKLTAANTEMWNGHVGTRETQSKTAAEGLPGNNYIGTIATPGVDHAGVAMTWCTCVAGCAAGTTGTITDGVFVDDAGTSVALSTIPANGFGWVKN